MRRAFLVPLLIGGLCSSPALADAPPGSSASAASAIPAAARALYFERALTPADLDGRTLRELSIMRNTIFARAGNPFRKDWLNAYFGAQPWYTPAKDWDPKKITALDWANAKAITTFESGLSKADLRQRVTAVQGRLTAGKATPADQVEVRLLSKRLGKWQSTEAPPANRSPLEDPTLLATQLTKSQLDNMSRRDLRLLRNTIYARHGYQFKSELLQMHFDDLVWYKIDPKFTSARLSKIDWRNTKLIKSVENSLGGPMTNHEHMAHDGWFSGA
ncbi:MAG: hypothetical protein ACI9U2_000552 [Bradymonadia bacterium]|jgi:hypothetical protein